MGMALRRLVVPGGAFIGGSFGLEQAKKEFPDLSEYLGPVDGLTRSVVENLQRGAEYTANAARGVAQEGNAAISQFKLDASTQAEAKERSHQDGRAQGDAAAVGGDDGDGNGDDVALELRDRLEKFEDDRDAQIEKHHQELVELQEQLQAEIDALNEDNKSLRRRLVLDTAGNPDTKKKTAAEMYADILAMRESADAAFHSADHLPRVVVLGDQSSGKTSVLEMVAQARLFPRGDGEMMTRTPIQVTMSPDTEHTAKLRDSSRVYRLDDRNDLADLREEIADLMTASIPKGSSVSSTTIALDVRGPGLRPMVLVDLPGMIQHHTLGMNADTKDSIYKMCRSHIENPHSIILCVQDATRDAEGSGFADVVREVDPMGDRTIFVLTKVDLAEKLNKPAKRLEKIMKGQVFDMKASNYFAVVTGTSDPRDSIKDIRRAEKKFFENSDLFYTGVVKANAMGTDNLARAVSKSFWELVNKSIQSELQVTGAELKRKENEWKSRYQGKTRMHRADLFVIGRHSILEAIADFNDTVRAMSLEQLFTEKFEARIKNYFIDTLYIGASEDPEPGSFKTNCENLLEAWVHQDLADVAIDVAQSTLMAQLEEIVDFPDRDDTFARLKQHVTRTCSEKLQWPPTSSKKIQHTQELKLRDNVVPDRGSWDNACSFMLRVLDEEESLEKFKLQNEIGQEWLWRWVYWDSLSTAQLARRHAKDELDAFFPTSTPAKPGLSAEEANGVCLSVNRATGAGVDADFVHETYKMLYKLHFLQLSIESASYCSGQYGQRESDNAAGNGLACTDVLLFWRMQNMLKATGNVLRVEALDFKSSMEDEVRATLSDIQDDRIAIQDMLQSPQVKLAEEIELIRLTQTKLNTFQEKLKRDAKVKKAR